MSPAAIKPKRVAIGRGDSVDGPAVTSDAVYAGLLHGVTVRLDRHTFRRIWEVESRRLRVINGVEDLHLLVGGAGTAGVRSTADGHLIWTSVSRFSGASMWGDFVVLDGESGIELRNLTTGELQRIYEVPGGYEARKDIAGDVCVVQNGTLFTAIDLVSGAPRWQRPVIEEMRTRLGIGGDALAVRLAAASIPDTLVAFFEGATFAMSMDDGSIQWCKRDVWAPYAWPTVHEGRTYAMSGHRLRALDEITGAVIYDVTLPAEMERVAYGERPGTIYAGRLAIGHESGLLVVFNLANGGLVSHYQAKTELWRTKEVDGRLLVAAGDGTVLVFDESIWRLGT